MNCSKGATHGTYVHSCLVSQLRNHFCAGPRVDSTSAVTSSVAPVTTDQHRFTPGHFQNSYSIRNAHRILNVLLASPLESLGPAFGHPGQLREQPRQTTLVTGTLRKSYQGVSIHIRQEYLYASRIFASSRTTHQSVVLAPMCPHTGDAALASGPVRSLELTPATAHSRRQHSFSSSIDTSSTSGPVDASVGLVVRLDRSRPLARRLVNTTVLCCLCLGISV